MKPKTYAELLELCKRNGVSTNTERFISSIGLHFPKHLLSIGFSEEGRFQLTNIGSLIRILIYRRKQLPNCHERRVIQRILPLLNKEHDAWLKYELAHVETRHEFFVYCGLVFEWDQEEYLQHLGDAIEVAPEVVLNGRFELAGVLTRQFFSHPDPKHSHLPGLTVYN